MSGSVRLAAAAASASGSSVVGAAAADGVDRPVVDDRQQPRLDAARALDVAGGIAPRAEERVLDDVLGEGGVGRDAVGDRVGHRSVSVVQVLAARRVHHRRHERARPDPHRPSTLRRVRRARRPGRSSLCAPARSGSPAGGASRVDRPTGGSPPRHRRARVRGDEVDPRRLARRRWPGTRRAPDGGSPGRTRPRSGSGRRAPCARGRPRPAGRGGSSGPARGRRSRWPGARAGRRAAEPAP